MSIKRYLLIPFLFLMSCLVSCKQTDRSKYAVIHKIWVYKTTKVVNPNYHVGLFYGSDIKINTLDIRQQDSIRFNFANGKSFTEPYSIAGDAIVLQYQGEKLYYKIWELTANKLGLIVYPQNDSPNFKQGSNMVEDVYEAK